MSAKRHKHLARFSKNDRQIITPRELQRRMLVTWAQKAALTRSVRRECFALIADQRNR
jgi:hypothetical protein